MHAIFQWKDKLFKNISLTFGFLAAVRQNKLFLSHKYPSPSPPPGSAHKFTVVLIKDFQSIIMICGRSGNLHYR